MAEKKKSKCENCLFFLLFLDRRVILSRLFKFTEN